MSPQSPQREPLARTSGSQQAALDRQLIEHALGLADPPAAVPTRPDFGPVQPAEPRTMASPTDAATMAEPAANQEAAAQDLPALTPLVEEIQRRLDELVAREERLAAVEAELAQALENFQRGRALPAPAVPDSPSEVQVEAAAAESMPGAAPTPPPTRAVTPTGVSRQAVETPIHVGSPVSGEPPAGPPPTAGPAGRPRRQAGLRPLAWLGMGATAALVIAAIVIATSQSRASASPPTPAAGMVAPSSHSLATTSSVAPTASPSLTPAPARTAQASAAVAPTPKPPLATPTASSLSTASAAALAVSATATLAPTRTATAASTPTVEGGLQRMSSFTAGQSLCDLAVDQSGTHLYVTDDGPERLLVIDPATQQQSAQYALTDSLCSIALDEGGDTAYVPTWKRGAQGGFVSSRIQAINLATGLITSLRADQFPTGPFFDARQRLLYAGDTAEPTLAIVGLGGVSDTLALPAKVNRVAVSPANGSLYLASPDANRVFVVDPVRRDVVATLSVGERPWGAVAEPQSGHVFVSLELSGAVAVVDPATETVLRTTTTGSHPRNLAVDPVHHRVYVLNAGSRTVAALDANGDLVATSPPLGGAEDLTGLAVAPQTGVVYVVSKTHIVALR